MSDSPRSPKQARSRERVVQILTAAKLELETKQPEQLTMEGIAKRARVPVGSLYQYFSDKDGLLASLARLVTDEGAARVAKHISKCHRLPWQAAVDYTVEMTLGYIRDSAEYRRILRTVRFNAQFHEANLAANDRVADLMCLHPAFTLAGISRKKSYLICRTAIAAAYAVQDLVIESEPEDNEVWIQETKRLFKGHLGLYLV